MTTSPISRRPDRIRFSGHTADDGLFGPDSVTWRISALPQMALAAHGAATLQMLHPMVMHMIDQASSFRTNPASRAELTALFGRTLTYGDTAAANRAAEVLAKIHRAVNGVLMAGWGTAQLVYGVQRTMELRLQAEGRQR